MLVINLNKSNIVFQPFSGNFYSRAIFRYLSVVVLILITYFFFYIEPDELAIFLLIRSAIRITSAFINPLSSGDIFFKKFSKQDKFGELFLPHFITSSLLITFLGFVLLGFLKLSSSFLEFIEFQRLDLILIFIWYVAITISNIFQHYFQINKQNILSGFSNGFFAQFLTLFFLIIGVIFFQISFSYLLFSFALGWLINCVFFTLLIVFNSYKNLTNLSLKKFRLQFFKNKSIFFEMLLGLFSKQHNIFLWISAFFLDTTSLTILGLYFYLLPTIQIPKQALVNSNREEWIKSFNNKESFRTLFLKLRNNYTLINIILLVFIFIGYLILNNSLYSFGQIAYFYELNLILIMLFINFSIFTFYEYHLGMFESIMILHGSSKEYLIYRTRALLIGILILVILNIFSPSLYSFYAMHFLIAGVLKLESKKHFNKLKLLRDE